MPRPQKPPVRPVAPQLTRLDAVGGKDVRWLWPKHIPRGKVTLIAGEPGIGKSTVASHLAAIVSNALPWPNEHHHLSLKPAHNPPPAPDLPSPITHSQSAASNVLLFASEDDINDTIAPRLEAMHANSERVFIATQPTSLDDPACIESALNTISRDGIDDDDNTCPLIIIDPIASYLHHIGGQNTAEVHRLFAPLNAVAAKHNAAIICITHLTRSMSGSALARINGGLGFTAAARSVWLITQDPVRPKRRLFLPAKNNVGGLQHGHAFTLKPADFYPDIAIPVWEPTPVTQSATEILNQPAFRKPVSQAESWLTATLSSGPRCSRQLRQLAEHDNIGWRSIERAKQRLGVTATLVNPAPDGLRGHMWSLPKTKTA